MRNVTIVGAGQSGLQLALGLLQNGYHVRLISNRTPEDFATGKVMSSQFMFGDALQAERDLGLNDWEKECPTTDALGVAIAGPDGKKAIDWVYALDKPGQAVDQRVKYPGWMKKFKDRGGELIIHEASVTDLENYARSSDLVIVAGGKGDITKLFERDASRSPFDQPQRALALTYVTGLAPYSPTRVAFNLAPTVGEYFVFPALTITGPCEIMVFEGIPGGPMDCWSDVKTAGSTPRPQHGNFAEDFIRGRPSVQRTPSSPTLTAYSAAASRRPCASRSRSCHRARLCSAWRMPSCSTIRSPARARTTRRNAPAFI